MNVVSKFLAAGALGVLAVPYAIASSVMPRPEVQDIHLSYTASNDLPTDVTQIITYNEYTKPGTGGFWAAATLAAGGGTIDDPFTKSSDNTPTTALMLGLTTDVALDGTLGQTHVVMMINNTAADAYKSVAWGTLFPGYLEANIAQDIYTVAATPYVDGYANGGNTPSSWQSAANELGSFTDFLKINANESNPMSSWISFNGVNPGHTTLSDYSVMEFSDGTVIGTGTASLTQATPVPEASASMMMLAGLGLFGAALRRRKLR